MSPSLVSLVITLKASITLARAPTNIIKSDQELSIISTDVSYGTIAT